MCIDESVMALQVLRIEPVEATMVGSFVLFILDDDKKLTLHTREIMEQATWTYEGDGTGKMRFYTKEEGWCSFCHCFQTCVQDG